MRAPTRPRGRVLLTRNDGGAVPQVTAGRKALAHSVLRPLFVIQRYRSVNGARATSGIEDHHNIVVSYLSTNGGSLGEDNESAIEGCCRARACVRAVVPVQEANSSDAGTSWKGRRGRGDGRGAIECCAVLR